MGLCGRARRAGARPRRPQTRRPAGVVARRALTVAGALGVLGLFGACDEPDCLELRSALRARYEPYGDSCAGGDECLSGSCDTRRTGACRCESDDACRSGLCLDSLCANPDHDRRLTPGLGARGAHVRSLCPGVDAAARRESADCGTVLAFLEQPACSACDEASLALCSCRSGAALHACALSAATLTPPPDGPLTGAQTTLCERQAEGLDCANHLGPADAPCGADDECRSGRCEDGDPANNVGATGDDPRDWVCVDPCATDMDCPTGWSCDPARPLVTPLDGAPFTCRKPA